MVLGEGMPQVGREVGLLSKGQWLTVWIENSGWRSPAAGLNFSNEWTVGLERIPQRELNGAWAAVDVSNLAKVRVGHTGIRLRVGSDVKGIEEVSTELDAMFVVDRKSLFHGHIDVLERRTGKRGRANI